MSDEIKTLFENVIPDKNDVESWVDIGDYIDLNGIDGFIEKHKIADENFIEFLNDIGNAKFDMQDYQKWLIDNGKATSRFSGFVSKAGSALKTLGAALASMAVNFLIVKGVETFIGLLDDAIVTAKEARESSEALTKAMSDFRKEVKEGNRTLSSVSAKYEELRKGVNSLGENVSLTSDEYGEYLDICGQLAELMPDMVSYWNDEGNAIIDTTKSVTELTEAYRENMRVKASQFLLHGDGEGNTVDSILKNYRDMTEGNFWDFEFLKDPTLKSYLGIHGHKEVMDVLEEAYQKDYDSLYQMAKDASRAYTFQGMRGDAVGALAALLKENGYNPGRGIAKEDFGAIHDMLHSTLTALKAEYDGAASQIGGIMQQVLLASAEYSSIKDDALQDSIQRFIQSIDSEFIDAKGLDTMKGIRSFMDGFLSAVSDEEGEAAKALVSLFDTDATAAGIRDALATIGRTVGADTDMLSEMLGLDGILKSESQIKVMMSKAVERILKASGKTFSDSLAELRERGSIHGELEDFMDANRVDTVDRMTLLMRELEKSGYDMQEAFRNYAASAGETLEETFDLSSHSEAIDSFQSKVKTLGDALKKLNSGEMASNDLTDLVQEFTSLDTASDTLASDIEDLIYGALESLYGELGNPPEGLKELLKGIADEAAKAAGGITSLSSSIQSVADTHSLMADIRDDMADGSVSAASLQKLAAAYEGMEDAVVAYNAGLLDSKGLYAELEKQYGKDLEAFRAASQSKAYDSEMYYSAVLGKEQGWAERMRRQYGIQMSDFRTAEEAKTAYLGRAFGDREEIWEKYYRVVRGSDGAYEIRATGNLDGLTGTNRTAIEKAKATVQQFLDDLNGMFRADFDLAGLLEEEAKEAEAKRNVFDWIETKLEAIQRKLKKFGEAVSDASLGYTDRKAALSNEINATVTGELPALEEALAKYKELADSVDLDEGHKELVRDGGMLVEYGTDSATADRIEEYRKWHDRILETQDAIDGCRESLKELHQEWLSLEESESKGRADAISKEIANAQAEITEAAYSGADTTDTYDAIIEKQILLAEAYRDGAEAMRDVLDQMEAEDTIERHSEKWEELTGKIDSYISLAGEAELAAKDTAMERFNAISERHGRELAAYEHQQNMAQNGLSKAQAKGYLDTAAEYGRLMENEAKILAQNTMKRRDLEQELTMLTNAGIAEGSERWHELNGEILSTNEAIADSELKVMEWANAIRQVKWDAFDFVHGQIAEVSEEADFLIKLTEGRTHEENGHLTDTGLASAALHKANHDLYVKEAQAYAEELERIEADIAADPGDTENIKRWGELAAARRDFILAAEEEKQAVISLVEEGIRLELDSLSSLIDKYGDALDAQKDLYDYQKKTASQSKDIARLQKMLAAYENDKSEEARAKIQKIRVELGEAQASMEDYQYEHYISEQKELLSSLYEAYKETLEARLDDTDRVFSDMADEIGANADIIASTIKSEAGRVNYQISQKMEQVWGKLDGTVDSGMGSIEGSIQQGNGTLSWIDGTLKEWMEGSRQDSAESTAAQAGGMSSIKESIDAVKDSVDAYFAQTLADWATLTDKVCGIEASMLGVLEGILASGDAHGSGDTGNTGDSSQGDSSQGDSTQANTGSSQGSSSHANTGNGTQQGASPSTTVNFIPKDDSMPKGSLDTEHSIVDMLKWHDYDPSFTARKQYYREMGYTDAYYGTEAQNRRMLDWMRANGYASGMYRAGTGEPKVLQRTAVPYLQESMARQAMAESTSLGAMAMAADIRDTADSPLWGMGATLPAANAVNMAGGTTENSIDVQFVFPNVMDYDGFMREAQKDRRFEQMVQDMTINRLSGGGTMDKYRHRF